MSDINVIKGAFGAKPYSEEDHAAVIAFLEEALARAKAEHATHCLLIMCLPDTAVYDGWSPATTMRPYVMVGALTEITQRYIRKNIQQE